jgi:aminoglycoside N3'-acetyltransferase
VVATDDISAGIRSLGLSGLCVCVHSSLRSFGWVEGGARAVVDGIVAEGCTLLVPTFSQAYFVPPPVVPALRPARNGWDYDYPARAGDAAGTSYSAAGNLINETMGAIPAAVLAEPTRVRGDHPLNSFAALGPRASELVSGQAPLTVYAPLEALTKAGGWVVLMGVSLTSMTLVHVAEQRAGRTPFRRWALDADGGVVVVEYGGCSNGFDRLEPVLTPLVRETKVGDSVWRSFPATEALEMLTVAIRNDPEITRCDDATCRRCADAVMGGPLL